MIYSLETIGAGEMLWTLFNAIAALLRPDGGSLIQSEMTPQNWTGLTQS